MLRDIRSSPFAWQHRRALDIIAVAFDGQQRATALGLYLTITWMASEQRSDKFTAFVRNIADRSGLGFSTTKRYLSRFEGKCQNSVLARPTRGKPEEKWGLTLQIAPLYGRHSA